MLFLPFDTWPTWAYPSRYMAALASSAFSMLRLHFPPLAVRATTTSVARGRSVSMFCIRYEMDLGPLCYTGSSVSARRATFDDPDSTACHFGSSLEQPRMAGFAFTMLASVQLI